MRSPAASQEHESAALRRTRGRERSIRPAFPGRNLKLPREGVLLLLFTVLCMATMAFGLPGAKFSLLTSGLVFGCCIWIIGRRFGSLSISNVHIWILFASILAGTLSKLTLLSRAIRDPARMYSDLPELAFVDDRALLRAVVTLATGLAIFTATLVILPNVRRKATSLSIAPARIRFLLIVTVLLGTGAALVQRQLSVGVLGGSSTGSSLATLVTRATGSVVPGLALLALFYAATAKRHELAAIIVHVGLAAGSSLLTTSRGTLFVALLNLVLMYSILGRIDARLIFISMIILVSGLVMFSLATSLRQASISGATSGGPISLVDNAIFVFTRIQGADGLLHVARYSNGNDLPIASSTTGRYDGGVAKYYTQDVVGVKRENDFRSPGLFAAVLIMVGIDGFPLGLVFLGAFSHILFGWLSRRGAVNVSAVMVASYIVPFSEGSLSDRDLLFFALTILGLSRVHHVLAGAPKSRSGRSLTPRFPGSQPAACP